MLTRRLMLAAGAALAADAAFVSALAQPLPRTTRVSTPAEEESFRRYLAGVRVEARRRGISEAVLGRALAPIRINWRVIELDRHQPEAGAHKFTWEQYRDRIVNEGRVQRGREQIALHHALLGRVQARYGVPPGILIGLWGLESDYGQAMGHFNVVEAVATLAWEGRRGAYFRGQLMDCLTILQRGDIRPEQMMGSWAGAMGQTQFMPDCFLKFAVDFDGDGRRDLWNNFADVFASTANNLAAEGWTASQGWGGAVGLPAGFEATLIGRAVRRPVGEWLNLGVAPLGGRAGLPASALASLVRPGDPGGDVFLVSASNFRSLRAYNPSDYYALSIGLLADRISA